MQAVILAAGIGKRMQKSSNSFPKGLIKIAGKEIVYRTMTFLKRLGVKEFILVTNPFCQSFYKNFVNKNGFSCQIIVNSKPERGNGYSLYLAKDYIKGKFILTMSDHIYEETFIEKAISAEGVIVDKIGRFIEKTEATKVQVKNGYVITIGKRIEEWDGFDTGFFVLSPEIFKIAEEIVKEKETVELSEIIEKARIKATEISGFFWLDVDTPSDLKKAKRALLQNAIKDTGDG
ncbi:MAG: NTP transferase domain-containing protein, partial [Candidatus Desulfofervidaceae bacterium]|nr:NTP transferase domain-containing protein [Candidatus Desulfofervidaceae bacterium]